jgi:N-dimethylarginine dimethylaminohydrolase
MAAGSFGVRSGYGDLKRVIMHRPGEELRMVTPRTLAEFNFAEPVDVEQFVADYDAMLDAFHQHDVETLLLTEILADDDDALGYIRHRPNMTYTRDLATVFKTGAVLMGPHLRGRWGDQAMLGRAFRRLGIPILGAIEQPDFLEGGGVIPIGEDTIAASICDRANENGTRALRELVLGSEARYFLDVPLPFGEIHIDGTFMVLDERLCVVHAPTFEVFPCRLYEAGKLEPRHVMFLDFLTQRGFTCITFDDAERDAMCANITITRRGKSAIAFAGAPRVNAAIESHGITITTISGETLALGNGGPHCMTCPVLVE